MPNKFPPFLNTTKDGPFIQPTQFVPTPTSMSIGTQSVEMSDTTPTQSESDYIPEGLLMLQQNKIKYHILNLFWLFNLSLLNNQEKPKDEADMVILSYNMDFGNMRLEMFNLTEESIQNNIVYLNKLERLNNGTIYPASLYRILAQAGKTTTEFICIEQLIEYQADAEWQKNRPIVYVQLNQDSIKITIENPKDETKISYTFKDWQYSAFLYTCQFIVSSGFHLTGLNILNK